MILFADIGFFCDSYISTANMTPDYYILYTIGMMQDGSIYTTSMSPVSDV